MYMKKVFSRSSLLASRMILLVEKNRSRLDAHFSAGKRIHFFGDLLFQFGFVVVYFA